MKNAIYGWLIAAAILILLGAALFGVTLAASGWDFHALTTKSYTTATHEITADFTHIAVTVQTADVRILPAADGKATVVCTAPEKEPIIPVVQDGTLTVTAQDNRAWYEHIELAFGSTKVTVYLPQKEYDTLRVKASTGDVLLRDTAVKSLDLAVTTGDVTMEGITCRTDVTLTASTGDTTLRKVTCQNLTTTADTGGIGMANVQVRQKLAVERSTGDVVLTACDGGDITIRTSTGDVAGTLLTPKTFTAESNTGTVTVPDTLADQRCRVYTSTGDIRMGYTE